MVTGTQAEPPRPPATRTRHKERLRTQISRTPASTVVERERAADHPRKGIGMSTIKIHRSVGANAMNDKVDVAMIQYVLNHFIGKKLLSGYKKLAVDGGCGPKTKETLTAFQIQNFLVSEEHFNGQIWPCGKTITFMNSKAGYISLPSLPDVPKCEKDSLLVDLLWQVETKKLTNDSERREHLARLRRFFIRGFEGDAIDHCYWRYSFVDNMGWEHAAGAKFSVVSLKRADKQYAFNNFIRACEGAADVDAVGKVLLRIEGGVFDSTDVVLQWYILNGALGDAPINDFTEMTYVKEMALTAVRSRPESIYQVYVDRIVKWYPKVMRPFLTADAIWQARQSGRK
jgi:hypothetical protein